MTAIELRPASDDTHATSRVTTSFSAFANFITTPDGAQRLNGPILRARVGVIGVPAASHDTSNTSTRIGDGAGLGLGACWSPHFDSRGWVILGCAEFGYSVLSLTNKEADGRAKPFETVGFGAGGPLFEVEYNLTSHLQVGVRAGGDFVAGFFGARRADRTKAFSSNPWAVYGSLGVGVHF